VRIALRYRSMLAAANAVASRISLGPLPTIRFEDPVFTARLTSIFMDHPLRQSMLYLLCVGHNFLPLEASHLPATFW
jgi:hypothetical protein